MCIRDRVGAVILIYGIFQIVGGIKTYSTSKGKGILSLSLIHI